MKTSRLLRISLIVLWSLVFLMAFIVRFIRLGDVPAGFFADEAAIGYNAWKILTTGRDEYREFLPFFFRSFGDYRNPFPIYANIPLIAFIGLTEHAVRRTAAIAGTATVAMIFFICYLSGIFEEYKSKILFSFVTTAFLATSPWHIHFSRFGSEYIYFPFLLSASILTFLVSQYRPKVLPMSGLLFGMTLYTYYPTWLVTPLFVCILGLAYRSFLRKHKAYSLIAGLLFIVSTVPLFVGLRHGIALTRWKNVAITKETKTPLPLFFLQNYRKHFTPDFLFLKGDIDYPGHFIRRFSSRGSGELFLIQAPLVLIGIISLLLRRKPFDWALLGLFLLYPLGSSFAATDGGAPLAFRSIIGVLPFTVISSMGVSFLIQIAKSKPVAVFLGIILLSTSSYSFIKYIQEYHTEYNNYSSDFWGWQFGPRDVMKYFLENKDTYDEMYLMGDFNSPEIFIKFYDPTNRCQNRCAVGGLQKYDLSKKQLFSIGVNRLKELPLTSSYRILHTIDYPSRLPAFYILTINHL